MVEAFRICKRAYQIGQAQYAEGTNTVKGRLKSLTRRFILRGLAEINRGKLASVNQVQKYMGQQWPVDILSTAAQDRDTNTRAFRLPIRRSLVMSGSRTDLMVRRLSASLKR